MTTSFSASVRGLVTGLMTALLALVLLTAAPPASAHDALVESVPAEGAVLETSPNRIELTYTGEVLEMAPVVLITRTDDGTGVAGADPTVDGRTVILEIPEPMTDGEYQAAWRVVSSDGHPIEGVLTFTVAAGIEEMPATQTPPADAEATAEETPAAQETVATEDAEAGATETGGESGLGGLPLWLRIAIIVAATASVVGIIVMTVRRSRSAR